MLSSLDRTPAVKHILIINVVVFALMNFVDPLKGYYEITALFYFDDPRFGFWQVITHMFQHSKMNSGMGIMHIIFNMFMLFQFGTVLEQRWGTQKFVFFYFVAGIGSALFFTFNKAVIFNYEFHSIIPFTENLRNVSRYEYAVGASGAVSGIVAAFAYLHPNTKLMLMFIPVPVKAKFLIGAFFAYDLFMGIKGTLVKTGFIEGSIDNIAHWAHLGGAFFGMLLLFYWQKNSKTFY